MGLEGQVAVVTGVTSGVGRGIAGEFARRGVKVVGTGRRASLGQALEEEVRDAGGELTYVAADVRVVDDCRHTIDTALERYGRVDILVNNAGTVGDPPLVFSHEATQEWWDEIVETNLRGAFFCSRYALEAMVAQRSGNIVNIASINGLNFGPARMAAYTASKAGLIALTKTMACEYATFGIRVNAIVLGTAVGEAQETAMNAFRREGMGDDYFPITGPEVGVWFTGAQLGAVLAFVCDADAGFINGAAIPVDGGVTAGKDYALVPIEQPTEQK